ncbi:hypothetical protein [Sphingobacterium pedocola]|uniref:Uncharacterized protein n=1 Tax=Sphingobacterium pedocola TaxID=2082722 RepID=A0ABR9T4C1_9SPHI|nr:hypothetical protein [Sphingobacterium pedocola]MBE8720195.1 hypothetical protein [Sphingobacterium pedocola]
MLFYFKAIIHFLFSNSRHGTHSPFVYRLADEVIYASTKQQTNGDSKSGLLIKEIAAYYSAEIKQDKSVSGGALDISIEKLQVAEVADLQHRFTILFLRDIHKNLSNTRKWNNLTKEDAFTVTIDLFYFGIVCQREGQRKEHFKLRFPFWKY